jgi:Flp pilus assembly secretin CpaC
MTMPRPRCDLRILFLVLAIAGGAVPAIAAEPISVVVDQASLVRLPEKAASVVIGNPLIADVSLQPGGMVVVTGKGYGATNVLAIDRSGAVILDRVVNVSSPNDRIMTVYRGVERESYVCTPDCQRRVMLGDGPTYFKATLEQNTTLNGQATQAAAIAGAMSSGGGAR